LTEIKDSDSKIRVPSTKLDASGWTTPTASPQSSYMAHFGILNVYKPPNCSSRDVVDRVERLTRPAKAGHAGTLDPIATGVLVICVGQATRLIQYVQQMPKLYDATFLLGQQSATDDTEGDVTPLEGAPQPAEDAIYRALSKFVGEIQQRPPAHSAVKVAGRRAYKLARQGKPVELAARAVTIYRIEVRRYEYPELELEIECGSGTYIRSLGRDLAASLGTAAVMSALVRTAVGGFRVEDAVAVDELSAGTLPQHLQPALTAVADLPRVELSDAELSEIRHGRPIASPARVTAEAAATTAAEWAAVDPAGRLAAILYEKRPGQLWPACNLT
jgi:tRNA pseudouridine55 synthase